MTRFRWIALFTAALVLIFSVGAPLRAEPLSDEQRAEVEKMIRDVLMENPEIIIEAVRQYEQKREIAENEQRQKALAGFAKLLEEENLGPTLGNPEGPVVLVEFSDYNCGYCKRAFPSVQKLIQENPDLRVVMMEFPILKESSLFAAQAALAADRQGKYEAFHTAMMELRGGFNERTVFRIAEDIGLDVEQLQSDMKHPSILKYLEVNKQLAQRLNVRGTPAFVVGNSFIPGAADYDTLQAHVDETRKLAQSN
ncbi:MAG: DsbA family protein [Magnetospiraceae bacterium]